MLSSGRKFFFPLKEGHNYGLLLKSFSLPWAEWWRSFKKTIIVQKTTMHTLFAKEMRLSRWLKKHLGSREIDLREGPRRIPITFSPSPLLFPWHKMFQDVRLALRWELHSCRSSHSSLLLEVSRNMGFCFLLEMHAEKYGGTWNCCYILVDGCCRLCTAQQPSPGLSHRPRLQGFQGLHSLSAARSAKHFFHQEKYNLRVFFTFYLRWFRCFN